MHHDMRKHITYIIVCTSAITSTVYYLSMSQFLDLDVFLRHSVDEYYNLNGILH